MIDDSSDDLSALVGVVCCLGVSFVIVGLAIWLIVRASKRAQAQGAHVPVVQHLSVLALSFDASFRAELEQTLAAPFAAAGVIGQRVELVARAARLLLALEPHWRDFGYGEKDLAQLGDVRTSFLAAVDDFRARAAGTGDGGQLAVFTVIIATRDVLRGVTSLEDRLQVRAVLEERLNLSPGTLLGAEVVWSPAEGALTAPGVCARFPEMSLLR